MQVHRLAFIFVLPVLTSLLAPVLSYLPLAPHPNPNASPMNSRFMLYKDLASQHHNSNTNDNNHNFNHEPQYPLGPDLDPHLAPVDPPVKPDVIYEFPVQQRTPVAKEIRDQQPLPSFQPLPSPQERVSTKVHKNEKQHSHHNNNSDQR